MEELYFATGNIGKLNSASKAFEALKIKIVSVELNIIEPQFDTFEEIAKFKIKQAFQLMKKPIIVHDGGLCIPSLNNFPGPYTKYVIEHLKAEGVLALIEKYDPENRIGIFKHTLAYTKNGDEIHCFSDHYSGTFSKKCSTQNGNKPWSDLYRSFIPKGGKKVLAEMTDEESEKASPIAREGTPSTWKQLATFLKER